MKPLIILALANGASAASLFCCKSSVNDVIQPGRTAPPAAAPKSPDGTPAVSVTNVNYFRSEFSEEKTMEDGPFPARIIVPDFEPSVEVVNDGDNSADQVALIGVEVPDLARIRIQSVDSEPIQRCHSSSSSSSPPSKLVEFGRDLLSKPPILPSKPADHEVRVERRDLLPFAVESLRVLAQFNDSLTAMQYEEAIFFQEHLLQLFSSVYPGMEGVAVAENDVMCLLLLALIHDRDSIKVAAELNELHLHFDSEILSGIAKLYEESRNAELALNNLFKAAISHDCVYTIEAFMALNIICHFEGQAELLEGIIKLAQMGATSPLQKYLTPELKSQLEDKLGVESLLLVVKKCHASTLALPIWTDEEVDAAAQACVENSDWRSFKCFMAQRDRQYHFLRPAVLEMARIIYSDTRDFEEFKAEFEKFRFDHNALVELMLKLGSPEPLALAAFKHILQSKRVSLDPIRCAPFDPLAFALFMDELGYLKLLLTEYKGEDLKIVRRTASLGNSGVWQLIRGSKRFNEIMSIIVQSPRHHVLHAIANPYLSTTLLETVLSDLDPQTTFNISFASLVESYGFDDEVITDGDVYALKLAGNRQWPILHLAVLALNVPAVKVLLSREFDTNKSFSAKDARTPLTLARLMKILMQGNDFIQSHCMRWTLSKNKYLATVRRMYPNFYHQDLELSLTPQEVRNEAIVKCEQIIELLSIKH